MYKSQLNKLKLITNRKYNWGDSNIAVYSKYTTKLLGALICKGHKLKALKRCKTLHKEIKQRESMEAYKLIYISLLKISPDLYVRFVKIAGQLEPIPRGLMFEDKRVTYAIKWAVKLLKDKSKTRNISMRVLAELLSQSLLNKGDIMSYRYNWQKLALENKSKLNFLKSRIKKI